MSTDPLATILNFILRASELALSFLGHEVI